MKQLVCLLILIFTIQTDPVVQTTFVSKTEIMVNRLIAIDNFNSTYYLNNNTLVKNADSDAFNYNNLQLGTVESVNIFNPLKINLFYKDFNSVVILDNRFAEIFKIDFNVNKNYRNISHISTGYDNTIWIFNQDTQQLELFDYKANSTKALTSPIESEVLDLNSNYNYSWLLTKDYIYKFNYFGINIMRMKNDGFDELETINENLVLKKNNKLFYLETNESKPKEIQLPKLLINAFFVNNETLYIYDNEYLYKYQLKIN